MGAVWFGVRVVCIVADVHLRQALNYQQVHRYWHSHHNSRDHDPGSQGRAPQETSRLTCVLHSWPVAGQPGIWDRL